MTLPPGRTPTFRTSSARQAIEPIGAVLRARDEVGGEAALKGLWMGGVALDRIWQRGCEQRRLARIELSSALVEIALRSRLNSEQPIAPFGDIEVDFDRMGFRPELSEDKRHADLDALA